MRAESMEIPATGVHTTFVSVAAVQGLRSLGNGPVQTGVSMPRARCEGVVDTFVQWIR